MKTNEKSNKARLEKQLDKLYNFEWTGGVLTLRDFIAKYPPLYKNIYTQNYSEKKINLEYKKLDKPKIHYQIWYNYLGNEYGIEVPKLVYDYLDLPTEKPLESKKEVCKICYDDGYYYEDVEGDSGSRERIVCECKG